MEIVLLRIQSYSFEDYDDFESDLDNHHINRGDTNAHHVLTCLSQIEKAKRQGSSYDNAKYSERKNKHGACHSHREHRKRAKI